MFKSIIAAIGTKATVVISGVAAVAAAAVITAAVVLSGDESYRVLKVFELNGSAAVTRESAGELDAYVGMNLESGDIVTVNSGTMRLSLDNNKYILLEEGTILELVADGTSTDSKTTLNLREGAILNEITEPLSTNSLYEVNAPKSTMAVRGTSFYVSARQLDDGSYIIDVTTFHGNVSTQLYDENGNKKGKEIYVGENKTVKIKNENTGSGHSEIDGNAYYVITDSETGELRPVADGETPTTDTVYIDVPKEILNVVLGSDDTDLLNLSDDVLAAIRGLSEETDEDAPAETTAAETTPAETTASATSETTTPTSDAPHDEVPAGTIDNPNAAVSAAATTTSQAITSADAPVSEAATTTTAAETTTTTTAASTTAATTSTAADVTEAAATTTEATTTTTAETTTAAAATTTAPTTTTTAPATTTTTAPATTATMTNPATATPAVTTTDTSAVSTSATLTTTPAATTTTEETTTTDAEPTTANVTFNYGESSEVVPITIGEAIGILPSVPDKTGYTGKWVIGTGDAAVDLTPETVIMSDTVISLVYTPIEYTVTFTKEDGSKTTVKANYGTTLDASDIPSVPTKNGYTGKWVVGDTEFTTATVIKGDTNVALSYTANSYPIIFDFGDGVTESITRTVTIGEPVGTLPDIPADPGRTTKWVYIDYSNAASDEQVELTAETVVTYGMVNGEKISVSVQRTSISYTINYIAGYDSSKIIDTISLSYGTEIPRISIPNEYNAVDTDDNGTMDYMVWGWDSKTIPSTVTGDEDITVPYIEYNKVVEVRIDAGSGYVSTLLEAGESYTLPEKPTNNTEKEADGYIFKCWTSASGNVSSSAKPGRTSFISYSANIEGGDSIALAEGRDYSISPTYIQVSYLDITVQSGDSIQKGDSTQLTTVYSNGGITVPALSGDITYTLTGYIYDADNQTEVTLSSGTTVTSDGILTIASDETASVIKITAVSAKYGVSDYVMPSITG